MRILIISDTAEFSGAEESIATLASLLHRSRNIHVRFCATRFIDNCKEPLPFEDSYVINRKKPQNIEEFYSTLLNPSVLTRLLRHCARVANDFHPDLVHSGIFLSALPSVMVARELKIPVIEHIHDYRVLSLTDLPFINGNVSRISYTQELRYYLRRIRPQKTIFAVGLRRSLLSLYNRCDLLIAVSDFVRKSLSSCLKPPVRVVYNVIDTGARKECSQKKRDRISIVYSARLSSPKGFLMFLQAAKRLLGNGVDAEFHLTGKGELEDFARSFAKKNSRNVQFHGYLPDDELNDLIANCHVTVHPSLWPDPCPLSVIKSVKLGTAAIASDRGGLPELLPPKYIFKPDEDQLHAKLLEFIKNPDDFPPLASIDMNPESAIAKLIEIYRQVVEGVQ